MAWLNLSRPTLLTLSFFTLAACGPETAEPEGASGGPGQVQEQAIEGTHCEVLDEAVACGAQDAGLRFCDYDFAAEDALWGPCLTAATLTCDPGEVFYCDFGGTRFCELDGGVPVWDRECTDQDQGGSTPLVISLDGAAVDYAPASATSFDTFAGGCLSHDWPTAATPWLVMDRDGSGFIEDGRELFGSGTRLANGARATNGFEALAELDENQDGVISALDSEFARLLLWQDTDADRRSAPGELLPLSAMGLTELEVGYTSDPRCDAGGNCEIERAAATTTGRTAATIVDIHLACR